MAKGKVKHVHYEPLNDGTIHYRVSREAGKQQRGPFLRDSEDETGSHTTPEAAGAHLTKLLGGKGSDKNKSEGEEQE